MSLTDFLFVSSVPESPDMFSIASPANVCDASGRAWARISWGGSSVAMDQVSDLTELPLDSLGRETRILFARVAKAAHIMQACHRLNLGSSLGAGLVEGTVQSDGAPDFTPRGASTSQSGDLDATVLGELFGASCAWPLVRPHGGNGSLRAWFSPSAPVSTFGAPYLSPSVRGPSGCEGWELKYSGLASAGQGLRETAAWDDRGAVRGLVETVLRADLDYILTTALLEDGDAFQRDQDRHDYLAHVGGLPGKTNSGS